MSDISAAQRAEERRQRALMRFEQARALAADAAARGDTALAQRLDQEARLHEQAAAHQQAAVNQLTREAPQLVDALDDAVRSLAADVRQGG